MTEDQIEKYRKASEDGSIPDAENPIFLFQGTSTKILVMALNKEFSLSELIRRELVERGLNLKGEWVGFKAAEHKKFVPLKKFGQKAGDHNYFDYNL